MNKVQEYYAYLGLAQSFAAITVPLVPMGKGDPRPHLNVKLFNVKTDKPTVSLSMLVDTGATNSILGGQHAKPLGIDDIKKSKKPAATTIGLGSQNVSYEHEIKIQIGGLSPVTVPFYVRETPSEDNFLGWRGLLHKAKLEVFTQAQKPQFRYTEQAVAALGNAQAYFRSRI